MTIINVGNHRVRHGDIMEGIDSLMEGQQADFIYSDPPWGQGNITYWQTMNVKMNNADRSAKDYNEFINTYFSIISKYAKDKVVLEYGIKWEEDIKKMSMNYGFKHNGSVICYYKSGSKLLPCHIHFLSKVSTIQLSPEFIQRCTELEDLKLVKYVFDYLNAPQSGICLDPMCGMGFTAQASKDRGMTFYGNELNRKRLEKTIDRLR